MLDNRNIAYKKNALLSLGTVVKHSANALFEEERPREKRINNLYGNIAYDLKEDIYKCWYSPSPLLIPREDYFWMSGITNI